eukprot:4868946-Pleurochrysis_carterae.AAC.1
MVRPRGTNRWYRVDESAQQPAGRPKSTEASSGHQRRCGPARRVDEAARPAIAPLPTARAQAL